jgi:hypothetical protein
MFNSDILTVYSTVLIKKLTVTQQIMKFPTTCSKKPATVSHVLSSDYFLKSYKSENLMEIRHVFLR